ncbi:MAG: ATP-binding protein [Treponema sp.]|nr:ATP-binding protein [Treponema sp.]
MTIETVQSVILQNQKKLSPNFDVTIRDLQMTEIPRKASVVIGIRRCGKSTFVRSALAEIAAKKKLPQDRICWLDFSDDRLAFLMETEPGIIADAYYTLFPENHNKKVYFFFDEIQLVKNWALFVNRLQNTETCSVFISGSSARLLSREIATELGARTFSWELYPFSFREYLRAGALVTKNDILANPDKVAARFKQYLKNGGFPELLYIKKEAEKIAYLQHLTLDVIVRDVALRYQIQDLVTLRILVLLLFSQMAKLTTVNKLKQRLAGRHFKISNEWISKYLDYLEDAFLLFPVEILSANSAVRAVNPKKIYCIDHALAAASDMHVFENTGALIENMVFVQFKRKGIPVHYYKTKTNYEIDFITGEKKDIAIYQVCVTLQDEETRKREIRAIEHACEELHCSVAVIITLEERETLRRKNCTIRVVRLRDWLLQ